MVDKIEFMVYTISCNTKKGGEIMRYVYACISDNRLKTMAEAKQTRKYKKAEELAKLFNADEIVIDICSSWKREKPNLGKILLDRENVLIVSDISALGKKEEVADTYQSIIDSHNEILLCYFDKYGLLVADDLSTVSLKFERKDDYSLSDSLAVLQAMSTTQFKSEGWRMYDADSIEAYWAHEKGEKSMTEILAELGVSRNTFLKRVSEYVGSDAWDERIIKENEESDIENLPMKIGEVSENGKILHEYAEKNPAEFASMDISVVASWAGIGSEYLNKEAELIDTNPTEAQRYRRKQEALAIHSKREMLKYRKFLRNKKYRK